VIEWLVDRYHVGTRDEVIVADVQKRLRAAPPAVIQDAIKRALARHHENQQLYRDVVGARIK
jgi:hypothetical protein